jgi:hypothetical protein
MKYIITFENFNSRYSGDFIKEHRGWEIDYSDRPGHYITDRLVERSSTRIHDPVIVINGLVKKMINYIEENKITEIVKYCVKFKNRGFHVIFDINGKHQYFL